MYAIRSYYGVDGISLPMVLLTTLLTPLCILFSFSITEKVKAFMVLFLLLETGMLGVFLALDLILFFLFWEVGLIPMYFLINIWGSANRRYASFKFFIYTMAGSVGLVITSYSIHYTKLYEGPGRRRIGCVLGPCRCRSHRWSAAIGSWPGPGSSSRRVAC